MSAARAFVLPALLFVLAAWLGRLGGAILAAASAPPPLHEPHPTCEQSLALKKEHAQLAERAQQLARALGA